MDFDFVRYENLYTIYMFYTAIKPSTLQLQL